jgi:glycopeptide antibiotics resistance protein
MKNNNVSKEIIRFLKNISSILYFSTLIYIFFFARRRRHTTYNELNLVPFKNIIPETNSIHDFGSFNYNSNLVGNIIIFIPFSFILIEGFKVSKLSMVVLIAFIASFMVEFLQYIFKVGVADINDIILNTTGAVIGYYIYSIYKRYIIKN